MRPCPPSGGACRVVAFASFLSLCAAVSAAPHVLFPPSPVGARASEVANEIAAAAALASVDTDDDKSERLSGSADPSPFLLGASDEAASNLYAGPPPPPPSQFPTRVRRVPAQPMDGLYPAEEDYAAGPSPLTPGHNNYIGRRPHNPHAPSDARDPRQQQQLPTRGGTQPSEHYNHSAFPQTQYPDPDHLFRAWEELARQQNHHAQDAKELADQETRQTNAQEAKELAEQIEILKTQEAREGRRRKILGRGAIAAGGVGLLGLLSGVGLYGEVGGRTSLLHGMVKRMSERSPMGDAAVSSKAIEDVTDTNHLQMAGLAVTAVAVASASLAASLAYMRSIASKKERDASQKCNEQLRANLIKTCASNDKAQLLTKQKAFFPASLASRTGKNSSSAKSRSSRNNNNSSMANTARDKTYLRQHVKATHQRH
eukprot:GHVT01078279.1.p1 GENE.GHVT01078279.1~~GHVT01078279.1.p1  ORF type:complete len:428 (-),score=99.87 GHVT01078279.1:334-1617(-)